MIVVRQNLKEETEGCHKNIIVKSDIPNSNDVEFNFPYKQAANALMSAEDYIAYVEKNGYHFTNALAEHTSKMMKNSNGLDHTWTASQVKSALEGLGYKLENFKITEATLGDVTYLANMYYADLYPDVLKDEVSCIKAAYKIANDIDGYKGMIFCRWTADAIGKAIKLDWKKFI